MNAELALKRLPAALQLDLTGGARTLERHCRCFCRYAESFDVRKPANADFWGSPLYTLVSRWFDYLEKAFPTADLNLVWLQQDVWNWYQSQSALRARTSTRMHHRDAVSMDLDMLKTRLVRTFTLLASQAEARRFKLLLAAAALPFESKASSTTDRFFEEKDDALLGKPTQTYVVHVESTLPSIDGMGDINLNCHARAFHIQQGSTAWYAQEWYAHSNMYFQVTGVKHTPVVPHHTFRINAPLADPPKDGHQSILQTPFFTASALVNIIDGMEVIPVDWIPRILSLDGAVKALPDITVSVLTGDSVQVPVHQFTPEVVARKLHEANSTLLDPGSLPDCLVGARCTVAGTDKIAPLGVHALVLYYAFSADHIFLELPPRDDGNDGDGDDGDDGDAAATPPPAKRARTSPC